MQNMQLDKEMISATLLGDFQGIGELFLESPNRHAMQLKMVCRLYGWNTGERASWYNRASMHQPHPSAKDLSPTTSYSLPMASNALTDLFESPEQKYNLHKPTQYYTHVC